MTINKTRKLLNDLDIKVDEFTSYQTIATLQDYLNIKDTKINGKHTARYLRLLKDLKTLEQEVLNNNN